MNKAFVLSVLSLLFVLSTCYAQDCASLRQPVTRPHWLSMPGSRIVLNPNVPMPTPSYANLLTSLPVSPAYYAGERPIRLPGLWSWYWDSPVSAGGPPTTGMKLVSSSDGWQSEGVTADFHDGQVKITSTGEIGWGGAITKEMTVNLDQSPRLSILVPQLKGGWCIKVNSGEQVDTLVMDGVGAGGFVVSVPEITGWHGAKTFKLRLFAVGKKGSSVTFSDVRFVEDRLADGAFEVKDSYWEPHQLISTAEYPRMAKLDATTSLVDESTIAQRLRIQDWQNGSLMLIGYVPEKCTVAWHQADHAVTLRGPKLDIKISVGPKGRWMGSYASLQDFFFARKSGDERLWAIRFERPKQGDEFIISAAFRNPDSAFPAPHSALGEALRTRELAWNRYLRTVPRPRDFTLHHLKREVTPQQIERMYYKAWVFLASNVLPPMPENDYPYPQIGCGKPSLWSEGHPRASQSAQWESILAMQFMAWVDPKLAWDAYQGMLTLVAKDGSMAGECLPTRSAETAWLLYSLTGDKDRLRGCYPAMKRWLVWKVANPRWIIGKHDGGPDGKGSDFVVSALLDMTYARRIAESLEMPAETAFWSQQIAAYSEYYRNWFWESPGGPPFMGYNIRTGERSTKGGMWVLSGLRLPPEILSKPQQESLLRHLRANWFEEKPFVLWNLSRYPNFSMAMRGMQQYGTPTEVAKMAEAMMTSVTMAGEFSEVYSDSFPVKPGGVTPSAFGAENIIDACLVHNGVFLGSPPIIHKPMTVENLRLPKGGD